MRIKRRVKTFMIPSFYDLGEDPKMVELDEDEVIRALAWRIHAVQQQLAALNAERVW